MSLWGNKDTIALTGTAAVVAANSTVTGTSTLFDTELVPGDSVDIAGTKYKVSSITSNTVMILASNYGGANATGLSIKGQQSPKSSSQTDDRAVFGATVGETTAKQGAVTHAGWLKRTVGSGGRSGRTFFETLVAGSMITGDLEDVVLQDFTILVSTNPANTSVNATASEIATFSVVAATVPTGGSLTYYWQESTDNVTFANVADAGIYSNSSTATLSIAPANTATDGYFYRAVVGVTGGDDVTSESAVLTITT